MGRFRDSISRRPGMVFALAGALAAGGVLGAIGVVRFSDPAPASIWAAAQTGGGSLAPGFADVAKRTMPAVVNISSSRVVKNNMRSSMRGGGGGDDSELGPLFREFFGEGFPGMNVPRERRANSLGSGVIVNADGYILTNNHVVEEATDIRVSLSDKREFKAKLVGGDALSDLAVLKLDEGNLPILRLSDSGKVEVGNIALAIGNPFGIGQTVTMGIISATGRGGLGIEAYEDFIQTDAAINPGNSGGALINTNGELIGINTAILSGGGGNAGVGFAIPTNMAKVVMDQLIKTGKVTRGYMGVGVQEVTPALSRAFGMKETRGVAITQVEQGSPAETGGIKAGDVITEVNGQAVVDVNSFRNRISSTAPGTSVTLKYLRNNAEQTATVKLAELPARRGAGEDAGAEGAGKGSALEGVSVEDLTPDIAQQLRIPATTEGVIVSSVSPASNAAQAGLRRGDVITQVNRQAVSNITEFERALRAGTRDVTLLQVNRGGSSAFIAVENR